MFLRWVQRLLPDPVRSYLAPADEGFTGQVIVLDSHRSLYFSIPKVACTSLLSFHATLLRPDLPARFWEQYGKDHYPAAIFRNPESCKVLIREQVVVHKDKLRKFRKYWKFAFVRNPWDRLVSCWKNKIRSEPENSNYFVDGVVRDFVRFGVFSAGMPFYEFADAVCGIPDEVSDVHFRSQHQFVTDANGDLLVDFVGHLETMEEDFRHVAAQVNLTDVKLPHLHKTEHGHYTAYYSPELHAKVAKRYARDAELFGYPFETADANSVAT